MTLTCFPGTGTAQKHVVKAGAFYSAQRPDLPPLPFNPRPELPEIRIMEGVFVFDDTSVDYGSETMMMTSSSAPPAPGGGGGGEYIPPYYAPTIPISGVPLLKIEVFDEGAKRISFNTRPGLVYRIEEAQDLNSGSWMIRDRIVADGEEDEFLASDDGMRFYRVVQEDERIQFPEWLPAIDQYMEFLVYTPVTSGTFSIELYADGQLEYSNSGPIPSNGRFGVVDGSYNPSQWPHTGYYNVNEWELRAIVTPATAPGASVAAAPIQTTVKKVGRRRENLGPYIGITCQQMGIFGNLTGQQDEVDNWFLSYFQANLQASEQVDFDYNLLDEFTFEAPKIYGATEWGKLRNLVARPPTMGPFVEYLHYQGHGAPKSIGSGGAATRITHAQLNNINLKSFPLSYAAIDGCRVADGVDFLKALIGYGKKITRQKIMSKGWDPRFAAGWSNTKAVAWVLQGVVNDKHFAFWADYYQFLTQRNPDGYLFRTYEQAYAFAKEPGGRGVDPVIQNNLEANGWVMIGCTDCVFDEVSPP